MKILTCAFCYRPSILEIIKRSLISLSVTHVGVKVVAAGDEECGAAIVEDDGVAAEERRVGYLGDESAFIGERNRFEHLRRSTKWIHFPEI